MVSRFVIIYPHLMSFPILNYDLFCPSFLQVTVFPPWCFLFQFVIALLFTLVCCKLRCCPRVKKNTPKKQSACVHRFQINHFVLLMKLWRQKAIHDWCLCHFLKIHMTCTHIHTYIHISIHPLGPHSVQSVAAEAVSLAIGHKPWRVATPTQDTPMVQSSQQAGTRFANRGRTTDCVNPNWN